MVNIVILEVKYLSGVIEFCHCWNGIQICNPKTEIFDHHGNNGIPIVFLKCSRLKKKLDKRFRNHQNRVFFLLLLSH